MTTADLAADSGGIRSWWGVGLAVLVLVALVGVVVTTDDVDPSRDGEVLLPDPDGGSDRSSATPWDPLGRPGRVLVSPPAGGCPDPAAEVTLACPQWQVLADGAVRQLVMDGDVVMVGVDNQVVVLDAATGGARWHRDLPAPMSQPPALDTETIYVLDTDTTMTALDRTTGALRWQTRVGSSGMPPVVASGTLVVRTIEGVTGLATEDGARLWDVGVSGGLSPPSVINALVFVGDGNGDIRAIDAVTGRVVWLTNVPGWWVATHDNESTVAVSGFGGPMVGLDRHTGVPVWESDEDVDWSIPRPMPGGGAFALQSNDGQVHIIDSSDGTSTTVASLPEGTAVVDMQGLLYLPDADGRLTAITPDGEQVWADTWERGIGQVVAGWVDGGPWMIALDETRTALVGLPTVRRPPPAIVDTVPSGQPCPATPLQDRPYRTVAAGRYTEVSGLGIRLAGSYETTFVSVTDQARTGPVTLRGHRLDAPGTMTFRREATDAPQAELVLTTDGIRRDAPFDMPPHWAILVSDLEPGCWSYDLHTEDGQVDQIIVHVTP